MFSQKLIPLCITFTNTPKTHAHFLSDIFKFLQFSEKSDDLFFFVINILGIDLLPQNPNTRRVKQLVRSSGSQQDGQTCHERGR